MHHKARYSLFAQTHCVYLYKTILVASQSNIGLWFAKTYSTSVCQDVIAMTGSLHTELVERIKAAAKAGNTTQVILAGT